MIAANREEELVELVDETGTATARATVAAAHSPPGHLHRAFSVLLLHADGRVLLQQRAAAKTRFPLLWGNSCCGHPAPGEPVVTAAERRLAEELGVRERVPLLEVGVFVYRATDTGTGRVEHEYDHVLLGRARPGLTFAPDPAEAAALRWVDPDQLDDVAPDGLVPWLDGVLDLFRTARTWI